MPVNPQQCDVENEILDRLAALTGVGSLNSTQDNLLTQFEYKRLCKRTEKVSLDVRRYALLALLELSYDRNVTSAEKWFNEALAYDRYDVPTWTTFVTFLSARGFASKAYFYSHEAVKYLHKDSVIHNAIVHALKARDIASLKNSVDLYKKLHPVEQPTELVSRASETIYHFQEYIKYEFGDCWQDRVKDILLKVQDAIGAAGYTIKSLVEYDDDQPDSMFVGYTVATDDMDEIGSLNMMLADLFVDNDWLDSGVRVLVMPHGV